MRALALVGLNVTAKTFADTPRGPYAPAYSLEDLPANAHAACEAVYLWSNGEGHLRAPLPMRCRAQTPTHPAPAYNGPSLSIGDVIRLENARGALTWWRCAALGFDPVADPDTIKILFDPDYATPCATLDGRIITPGSDWKIWMDRMVQETIREQ